MFNSGQLGVNGRPHNMSVNTMFFLSSYN